MKKDKKLLYRKENTKALHYRCNNPGSDFRHERNTKKLKEFGGNKKSMKGSDRGRDYAPLYMFLLSKVGKKWDDVYSEAASRLDTPEPIFHLVAKHEKDKRDVVRCGENSRYSGLFIDDDGLLQKVDPTMTNEKLYPSCHCCTHTFNGKPLSKTYDDFNNKHIAK
jgi:hypothetical protein